MLILSIKKWLCAFSVLAQQKLFDFMAIDGALSALCRFNCFFAWVLLHWDIRAQDVIILLSFLRENLLCG